MLINARELQDGTTLRASVCVIGAGAAGIAIARELSRAKVDVLLLESGGFSRDPRTTALYEGLIEGEPYAALTDARLRVFGESTQHWAGFCRPLDRIDFEQRPGFDRSGWPFGLETLAPYYERAAPVVGIDSPTRDWRSWDAEHDLGPTLVDDELLHSRTVQISSRRRFGEEYRRELVQSPETKLCIWSNVVGIDLEPDGGRVAGLRCAVLGGPRFRAVASQYVVATGGLEVPRLLLASRDVQTAGIGNGHDLVGRCFMEHLSVGGGAAALAVADEDLSVYRPSPDPFEVPHPERGTTPIRLMSMLSLGAKVLEREGMRSAGMEVLPAAWIPVLEAGTLGEGVRELVSRSQPAPGRSLAAIRLIGEQEPNPASRVRVSETTDELGVPRIVLDWRPTRNDRENLLRTMEMLGRELGRRGLGRAQVAVSGFVAESLEEGDPSDFVLGVGFHHMGTARMHASPRQGVVDADCRIHDVANLYVAGSAVFPTGGASPPTLTIVALALRLSDHLIGATR